VVTYQLADDARGIEWNLPDGFFRLVVDPSTDAILGGTFVGYEAGELIHVILAHMQAGSTWRVLERSVHIHPTFAEGIPSLARLLL
jgi:dihydrolipoamide dehydrogenase